MGPVSVGDSIVTSRWIRTAVFAVRVYRQTRGKSLIFREYSTTYLYFHCFASKRRGAPRLETVWIPDRRFRIVGLSKWRGTRTYGEDWPCRDCNRGRARHREAHRGTSSRARLRLSAE